MTVQCVCCDDVEPLLSGRNDETDLKDFYSVGSDGTILAVFCWHDVVSSLCLLLVQHVGVQGGFGSRTLPDSCCLLCAVVFIHSRCSVSSKASDVFYFLFLTTCSPFYTARPQHGCCASSFWLKVTTAGWWRSSREGLRPTIGRFKRS